MKRLLLLLITALTVNATFGQTSDVSIKLGPVINKMQKLVPRQLLGYDKTGLYGVAYKRAILGTTSPNLLRIGFNLSLQDVQELETKIGKEKYNYEYLLRTRDGLYLFLNQNDKSSNEKVLYYIKVNPNNFSYQGNPKAMQRISYGGGLKIHKGSFGFQLSPDTSKLLVIEHNPYKGEKDDQFAVSVYNSEIDQQWSKAVSVDVKDKNTQYYDSYVTNEGVAVITMKVEREGRGERNKPDYDFRIYVISNDREEATIFNMELQDRWVRNARVAINDEGQLFAAGTFHSFKTNDAGIYSMLIDLETGKTLSEQYRKFSKEFMEASASNRRELKRLEKGKSAGIAQYVLDDIVVLEDGNFLLMGEQFDVHTQTYTSYVNGQMQTRTVTYYEYGNLLAAEFSKDGSIRYLAGIDKYQYCIEGTEEYASYAHMISSDGIRFIFNEGAKNFTGSKRAKKLYTFDKPKESILTMATVNELGEVKYEPIYKLDKADALVITGSALQVSDKEMLVGLRGRKTSRYMSIGVK